MNNRAFILDDDKSFTYALKHWLARKHFDVKEFSSIQPFVTAIRDERPNVIFIDLNISAPQDGLSVMEILRKDLLVDVPILMVSGSKNKLVCEKALSFGANDYLIKPLESNILVNRLSRYFKDEEHKLEPKALLPKGCVGSKVSLAIDFNVIRVDEFGATLIGDHLIPVGSLVQVDAKVFQEIVGHSKLFLRIDEVKWVPKFGKLFYYATFDHTNEDTLVAVRKWLLSGEKAGGLIYGKTNE